MTGNHRRGAGLAAMWIVLTLIAASAAMATTGAGAASSAAASTTPIGGAAASRVVFWTNCWNLIGLSDAQLDLWHSRGVGGFVCKIDYLRGLGGTQDFTSDPQASLSAPQFALQQAMAQNGIVRRAAQRDIRMWFGVGLGNYYNPSTPLDDWFDDAGWTNTVLPALNRLAGAAKTLGFTGLAFDEEPYPGKTRQPATWDWDYPGNTHSETDVRAEARTRGTQMMGAILSGFPGADIMDYDANLPDGWEDLVEQVVNGTVDASAESVQINLWDGLTSVAGYGNIWFLNAVFYKTSGLSGSTWDNALTYDDNRLYAMLSRRLSNWSYAASHIQLSPFAWIDAGPDTNFDYARSSGYVAAQLQAFRKWGTGGLFANYVYSTLDGFDYTPYVPALQAASAPGVVETTPPTLSIGSVQTSGTTVTVTGSTTDALAIRSVRWQTGTGVSGAAPMQWVVTAGDYRTGYQWRMDWTASIPNAASQPITITGVGIKGLTTSATIGAPPPNGGGGGGVGGPAPTVIAAVGSSTTEDFMAGVLSTPTAVNVPADPANPTTVPGDTTCAPVVYGENAQPGVVAAPDGSDAGRDALRDSVAGTFPDPVTGAGRGCVDIARSDTGPRPIGPRGDNPTFEYYAYALDAVAWASPSLNAPSALTQQQLQGIYTCSFTNWSQVGGAPGPIQRILPPDGAATLQTFLTADLGVANAAALPGSGPNCPPIERLGENEGFDLFHGSAQYGPKGDSTQYPNAILPYDASQWIRQANNSTNPSIDLRAGIRPGSLLVAQGSAGAARVNVVRWSGSEWSLNNVDLVGNASQVRTLANVASVAGSSTVTASRGSFLAGDVGQTVSDYDAYPTTKITAVAADGSSATIAPPAKTTGTHTARIGFTVVSEGNANAAAGAVAPFPGIHYLYNVIDSREPGYAPARALVGFQDSNGGARSPLCSGAYASDILSAGFLDLTPRTSPGGNPGVTCREQEP